MDTLETDGGVQMSSGTASSMREWQEASEPKSMRSWTHATPLERVELLGWDEV